MERRRGKSINDMYAQYMRIRKRANDFDYAKNGGGRRAVQAKRILDAYYENISNTDKYKEASRRSREERNRYIQGAQSLNEQTHRALNPQRRYEDEIRFSRKVYSGHGLSAG